MSDIVLASQTLPAESRSTIGRVLDRVTSWLTGGGAYAQTPEGGAISSYWMGIGGDSAALPLVTEASVLGVPPFGRGTDLIASTVAGVELRAYRYDAAQSIDVRMEPAPQVLRDPDPMTTPWNWKFALVNDLILYGNHFAYLGEPNAEGWPTSLQPIDPAKVSLATDRNTGQVYWAVGRRLVPFGELFHISAGNKSGRILGRGVIKQYFDSLGGVLATDRHARQYFNTGGLPSAVIKASDPDFSQEQAEQVKTRYRQTIGAGSREPLVLSPMLDFVPVVSDAEKQQLVQAREWDAQAVAMILGIPSTYLGLQGPSMNYTTVETVDIGFIRDTVDRWAKPVEQAATKWLLPRGQVARFDWSGRMRFDSKSRAETLAVEIQSGLLTAAEGRQMMDRPPLTAAEPPAGGTVDFTAPPAIDPSTPTPSIPTMPEVAAR